jgi:hypothetical protein
LPGSENAPSGDPGDHPSGGCHEAQCSVVLPSKVVAFDKGAASEPAWLPAVGMTGQEHAYSLAASHIIAPSTSLSDQPRYLVYQRFLN